MRRIAGPWVRVTTLLVAATGLVGLIGDLLMRGLWTLDVLSRLIVLVLMALCALIITGVLARMAQREDAR